MSLYNAPHNFWLAPSSAYDRKGAQLALSASVSSCTCTVNSCVKRLSQVSLSLTFTRLVLVKHLQNLRGSDWATAIILTIENSCGRRFLLVRMRYSFLRQILGKNSKGCDFDRVALRESSEDLYFIRVESPNSGVDLLLYEPTSIADRKLSRELGPSCSCGADTPRNSCVNRIQLLSKSLVKRCTFCLA